MTEIIEQEVREEAPILESSTEKTFAVNEQFVEKDPIDILCDAKKLGESVVYRDGGQRIFLFHSSTGEIDAKLLKILGVTDPDKIYEIDNFVRNYTIRPTSEGIFNAIRTAFLAADVPFVYSIVEKKCRRNYMKISVKNEQQFTAMKEILTKQWLRDKWAVREV